jgi:hypothetical protein
MDAYVAKDRQAIEALLADDFHFTSPYDNRIDRKTYLELCWPASKEFKSYDIQRLTVDGDHAFLNYEAQMGGKRMRNMEVHTVRGDRLVDVEVYFGWDVPHPAKEGAHKQ